MSKMKMQFFDCEFSKLSDDLLLNILYKLEDDPRHWARLSCVSTRVSSLIHDVCCKDKCSQTIPAVVADLLSAASDAPPGGWASMYKLAVSCPGLSLSGILLENLDFGLERELGPEDTDVTFMQSGTADSLVPCSGRDDSLVPCPGLEGSLVPCSGLEGNLVPCSGLEGSLSSCSGLEGGLSSCSGREGGLGSCSGREGSLGSGNGDVGSEVNVDASDGCWSLYDDLLFDTMYDESESTEAEAHLWVPESVLNDNVTTTNDNVTTTVKESEGDYPVSKRKKISRCVKSHLASGVWSLSREQGKKLLASRFKGDCLYICDWPGCIHLEEKRSYMLFRGIFKNFKQSRVWRTINDGKRKKIDLNCAFCGANQTWDLHAAFCLRSHFGFHDDGEPVVRAYVCENGHVSGAWTDWPLFT